MSRVVFAEERVPAYRVPFLTGLREELARDGIELSAVHGEPSAADALRDDSGRLPWGIRAGNRHIRLAGTELVWQPILRLTRDAELVIVDQASRLLVNYPLLGRQLLGGPRIAMFGHGANLQADGSTVSRASEALKKRYTRLPHWFFAYTQGSARRVERLGFPAGRVTVVQNALDTSALIRWYQQTSEEEVRRCYHARGLSGRNTCLYVGSLHAHKRLDFLLEAGRAIVERVPDFELVVIGAGPQQDLIASAQRNFPWLHHLGACFGREKAVLARGARLMLMPGLVGLVVLDAFALRLPVVTTAEARHSPEIEYLTDGADGMIVTARGDPARYAAAVVDLLDDHPRLDRLRHGCARAAAAFPLEEMVRRFAEGITEALAAPPTRRAPHW